MKKCKKNDEKTLTHTGQYSMINQYDIERKCTLPKPRKRHFQNR